MWWCCFYKISGFQPFTFCVKKSVINVQDPKYPCDRQSSIFMLKVKYFNQFEFHVNSEWPFEQQRAVTLHKKWSFSWRISSEKAFVLTVVDKIMWRKMITFIFSLGFLSGTFTIHRTAGALYHFCPPHRHLGINRAITSEISSQHLAQSDSNWEPLVSDRKSLTSNLLVLVLRTM